MSRELVKEEVILNKKDAIKKLNGLLEYFINEPSGEYLKKANLISYWLRDYAQYIRFEDEFDPTRNISYKRGNIVKLSFGFNVGSEYGGLHYGIVLDKKNDHNATVLTVIPLTSIKPGKEVHKNSVELGNEIYRSLKIKYDTLNQALIKEREDIQLTQMAFSTLIEDARKRLEESQHIEDNQEKVEAYLKVTEILNKTDELEKIWKEKEKHNATEQEILNKIGNEIASMKEGSVALINQITTVSKMRIFDPKNVRGVLSGISLSEEAMEKINDKVKELYIF